jgi:hypothetical protein
LPTLEGSSHGAEMEHLTCFVGGMLALGSASGILGSEPMAKLHLDLAKNITYTCYQMYSRMPCGIGPEAAGFDSTRQGDEIVARDKAYHLRPETVESIFILWKVTKDPIYRNWGWEIFLAIEANCKTTSGYAGIKDVSLGGPMGPSNLMDKQESFFLAETLKYLFLLFSNDSVLPLAGIDDKDGTPAFVFNTEAHPLKAWIDGGDTPGFNSKDYLIPQAPLERIPV